VQGLLVRDGRVLIGRRKIEPRRGYWDLPGGFLEEGEEPIAGLRREFLEETGLEVEPVEWVGAFIDPYEGNFVLGLTWIVRGDGEPVADDDVEELAWISPDELPVEMAFANQDRVLRFWAARHRDT
jgi:8-oxo-dGTP diphosphatase